MGEKGYIRIPGTKTHELPPLLIHSEKNYSPGDLASALIEAEAMLAEAEAPPEALEARKYDLALQLKDMYRVLISHWLWGDSVVEWIRQCEITFECEEALRQLLHPDLWPHAGRASFVTLIRDKQIPTGGIAVERAVGLRLTFRQPPPIDCFSNQFLFYLNSTVADSAYEAWRRLGTHPAALLPPERFHFEVLDIGGE